MLMRIDFHTIFQLEIKIQDVQKASAYFARTLCRWYDNMYQRNMFEIQFLIPSLVLSVLNKKDLIDRTIFLLYLHQVAEIRTKYILMQFWFIPPSICII